MREKRITSGTTMARRARRAVISLFSCFAVISACCYGANAGTNESRTPSPGELTEPRTDLCASIKVTGKNWLDQTHDYVDRKFCQPAVWFDDFFGEDRLLEDLRPTMLLSFKNSARWSEGSGTDLIPDYRLRYRLPQLDKFLKQAKLFVTSGSTAEKFTAQPGKPLDPGVNPATKVRKPTIALRTGFRGRRNSLFSFDLGMKARLPLDPFVRARYQNTKLSGGVYTVRFTETALWRYVERFTGTSQMDIELKKNKFSFVRWSNYATFTDGSAGITWNTGVSFITQLTKKSAVSYDTAVWGTTRPRYVILNYRTGIKYRRNFYRPWLFFEVEPEITWPKTADGRREPVIALTASLEIQFGR